MLHRLSVSCILTVAALGVGCGGKEPPQPDAPRPVTVVQLETIDPVKPLQISGSVRSWNEQSIAFEVAGPVSFIVRETTNLEGRWIDQGVVVSEGQLLAQLKDREFVIERNAATANLKVAKEDLALARSQLEGLLPARLRASEANQTRAQAEFERFSKARANNAVAELEVIRHKADLDQRIAEVDEAKASIDSKKVEIESLKARVDQSNEALAQAEYDLERCTLWAPFTGEVSEVFIEAGGYAKTAESVAHLVMMDPIKVDIAVSAERAAQLRHGDQVKLFPLAGGETYGFVYEKATAADSKTRAFRVSVMARNARVISGLQKDHALGDLPRIELYNRVQRIDTADPDSPLAVEEREALRKDDQGYFVWGSNELPRGQSLDPAHPVLTFQKVRVVPGEVRRNFQGLFIARSLEDAGELDEDWVVAHHAPEDFKGGEMLVAIRDWQLRPGQIVPVLLGEQVPEPGRYVPMRALTKTKEGAAAVFVNQDGVARRVLVSVSDVVAELIRVEPADSNGSGLLKDGAQVIMDFVHFLREGEPVQVVRTKELIQ